MQFHGLFEIRTCRKQNPNREKMEDKKSGFKSKSGGDEDEVKGKGN